MNSASIVHRIASLCLLLLLAASGSGCAYNKQARRPAPSDRAWPSGPDQAASASPSPLATQGDYADSDYADNDYGSHGYGGAYPSPPAPDPAPADERAYEMPTAEYDHAIASAREAPRRRPGLGTRYGESHFSQVTTAPFVRGSSQPDVLLSLWYNDDAGVRQARGRFGRVSRASTTDGVFVTSIVDEHGYAMSAAQIDDKRYVIGQPGQRYRLRIQNNSAYRYEVVASVDGLDVIDGDSASFVKRGYIIEPWSSITIDGWRTSEESIAAFRFSSMQESYAERKGQGRNIGVVGFAFFHERGGMPWQEQERRDRANPFPLGFAEPPPARRSFGG